MSSDQNSPREYIENHLFEEIKIGESAEQKHTLTAMDIDAFAIVSADVSPKSLNQEYVNEYGIHEVNAHGMWGGALIANILGTQLPGPGTTYLKQSMQFLGPVSVGDTVLMRVTVLEKDSTNNQVTLSCLCTNEEGTSVIKGQAIVVAPKEKIRQPQISMPDLALQHRGAVHDRLLKEAQQLPALPTAVVHPCDRSSLEAALKTCSLGLIEPILVGPRTRIVDVAENAGLNLDKLSIVDTEHSHASAERAVQLVREGRARALMKGALHTDEVMSAVVSKSRGLRTERRMSHVYVMDVPSYSKPLIITDAAINIGPDLDTKSDIIQNAIDLARAIGIDTPKVAILSAVETITTRLQSTVEAGALCKMADRGQITGGLLDGPLAFDNAISMRAVATKGIQSDVAGQADVLVAPDLEAGNMIAKQLMYLAGAEAAGVVLGAQVPIILTSRADNIRTRIASAAIASLFHEARHK